MNATYWQCFAGHNHLTPRAAARCRGREPVGPAAVAIALGTVVAVFGCLYAAGSTDGSASAWWVAGAVACFLAGVVTGGVAEARR